MTTYMEAHEFLRPIPYHALLPGSIEAVEVMVRQGAERRIDRIMESITTDCGNPPRAPRDGSSITANARKLYQRALGCGFEALLHDFGDQCMVEGVMMPERVGFRAWWTEGSADGATWHEPWRYEVEKDERPIGIDQRARTAKVGCRGAGSGDERIRIVATPWGKRMNHTELGEMLDRYDS